MQAISLHMSPFLSMITVDHHSSHIIQVQYQSPQLMYSATATAVAYEHFYLLQLAFGKTVHTFQGQNAGPVAPGQPPNAVN